MQDLFNVASEWWNQYYPMVVGFVTMLGGVVMAVLVVWNRVKPILDKLKDLKQTVVDKSSEVDPLKMIQASTLATDLRAKLENPTISPELKLQYQSQLYELEKIISSANTVTGKIEETTNKYL